MVAVGTASEHHPKGQAEATAYVGLRIEAIESEVCALSDTADRGYQQRTTTEPIGYLMPEARWRGWLVTSETADGVAEELATVVTTYGLPYLMDLLSDSGKLLHSIRHSAAGDGSVGRCRQALILAKSDRLDEARFFVRSCSERVEGEDGPWAEQERQWTTAFGTWAAQNSADNG